MIRRVAAFALAGLLGCGGDPFVLAEVVDAGAVGKQPTTTFGSGAVDAPEEDTRRPEAGDELSTSTSDAPSSVADAGGEPLDALLSQDVATSTSDASSHADVGSDVSSADADNSGPDVAPALCCAVFGKIAPCASDWTWRCYAGSPRTLTTCSSTECAGSQTQACIATAPNGNFYQGVVQSCP